MKQPTKTTKKPRAKRDCNTDLIKEVATMASDLSIKRYHDGKLEASIFDQLIMSLMIMKLESAMGGAR